MKAIAAMSLNRVIGVAGRIPWHLPEDFRWFKRMTTGQAVLMGRKTFESLGKPLPNRLNLVVTRGERIAGVEIVRELESLLRLRCELVPLDCHGCAPEIKGAGSAAPDPPQAACLLLCA